jgi:hypothetical protein
MDRDSNRILTIVSVCPIESESPSIKAFGAGCARIKEFVQVIHELGTNDADRLVSEFDSYRRDMDNLESRVLDPA